MAAFIGIEIGGTKLQILTGDEDGNIIRRFYSSVELTKEASGIRSKIEETLRSLNLSIDAIGVGFGGPVDWHSGTVIESFHVEGWSGHSLRNWLNAMTDTEVFVDNDANVAALGEAMFGAGRKYDRVFYVTTGSGVGGGFVLNEKIYHGSQPGEMELGHVLLDRSGRTIESSCSGWSVDRKLRNVARSYPESVIAQLLAGTESGEALILPQALNLRDPYAAKILNETADDLAFGLSHIIHLIHPDIIILGGGLSLIGESWRVAVEKQLPKYTMKAFQPCPPVVLSKLKKDAVPLGAIALASRLSIKRSK